jgi:glycosyltransferase involved in cell wall biosynthesis
MKVLFIAYFFPPLGGAGVQRAEKFVKYLPSQGFLPVVITGPASPESRWTPHDQTLLKSIPDGVNVHRVERAIPNEGGKLQCRAQRWLRLPTKFSEWWIEAATGLGLRVAHGEKLIFATMSPFESGEVARRLSRRLGIPWVADLRDPWALDEMQVYPTGVHRTLELRKMEKSLSTAAIIIMNTPDAAAALKFKIPSLKQKTVLSITNGFDREDFLGALPARDDGKFRIVHAGYLHTNNGLELRNRRIPRLLGGAYAGVDILTRSHTVLLQAIERWRVERPEIMGDVELVFAGNTSEQDRAVAEASSTGSMMRFAGYLSHAESLQLVRTADLLFLPMHNLPRGQRCRIVPGKTYEYMASGRPILAAVPDGDARDFLDQCGTASICRPNDVPGMVRLLDRAYSAWKNKETIFHLNDTFVNQFERCNLTQALAHAFSSLSPSNRGAAYETKTHLPVLS